MERRQRAKAWHTMSTEGKTHSSISSEGEALGYFWFSILHTLDDRIMLFFFSYRVNRAVTDVEFTAPWLFLFNNIQGIQPGATSSVMNVGPSSIRCPEEATLFRYSRFQRCPFWVCIWILICAYESMPPGYFRTVFLQSKNLTTRNLLRKLSYLTQSILLLASLPLGNICNLLYFL